jgi:hypothetical protein
VSTPRRQAVKRVRAPVEWRRHFEPHPPPARSINALLRCRNDDRLTEVKCINGSWPASPSGSPAEPTPSSGWRRRLSGPGGSGAHS